MIVQRFLTWVSTAPPGKRAEATSALARAFLYSDLSPADRRAAEAALTVMLDDISPLVREALATALGASPQAPRHVILALAADQPEIASIVVEASPLLMDAEIVSLVQDGDPRIQRAAARRREVSPRLSDVLVEAGGSEISAELLCNSGARLAPTTLDRLVERHGADTSVREILLAREDLPAVHRQMLVGKVGASLSAHAVKRAWLGRERAMRVTREACERETVRIVVGADEREAAALAAYLRTSGQLTPALLVRVALAGGIAFLAAALAELSGIPAGRARRLVEDLRACGLEAVAERAGLPASATHALALARDTAARPRDPEVGHPTVDELLGLLSSGGNPAMEEALAFLRRLSADIAREEARRLATGMRAAA